MTAMNLGSALKRAARISALAVAAAPFFALAEQDAVSDAVALDIAERIEAIESQSGATSADLIDPLTTLSLHYEESGEPALALALIGRITHVMHVNYGLHSLDEAPLIQRAIRLEEARGNAEAAWALEQELLVLARRHGDHPGAAPIFRYMAGRRLEVLARYQAGEFPPQIVLGCYYWEPQLSNCRAGSKSRVIHALRAEARGYYAEAAAILARNEYLTSLCTGPAPPASIAPPCL